MFYMFYYSNQSIHFLFQSLSFLFASARSWRCSNRLETSNFLFFTSMSSSFRQRAVPSPRSTVHKSLYLLAYPVFVLLTESVIEQQCVPISNNFEVNNIDDDDDNLTGTDWSSSIPSPRTALSKVLRIIFKIKNLLKTNFKSCYLFTLDKSLWNIYEHQVSCSTSDLPFSKLKWLWKQI